MKNLKNILVVTLGVLVLTLVSCEKKEVEPQKQEKQVPTTPNPQPNPNPTPNPTPTDSDGDGVNDDVDACPNEVGTVANNGCPENNNSVTKEVTYQVTNNSIQPSQHQKRWGDFEIKYFNGVDTLYKYITTDENNPLLLFDETVNIEVGQKYYIKITESNTNYDGELTLDVLIDGSGAVDMYVNQSHLPTIESYDPLISSLTSWGYVR